VALHRIKPFGPKAHDSIGALLEIAAADVDVDDSSVDVLPGLQIAGVEQDGRADVFQWQTPEPVSERAGRGWRAREA
jgi:hypothetical protein